MTLPVGYMLCVQTSENGGSVRMERILPGLSSADARLFHAIASDFHTVDQTPRGAGGDKFIQPAYLAWYRNQLKDKHPDISPHVKALCSSDMEFYANVLCLVLGDPSDYLRIRGIYVRKVDAFQMYYIDKQYDPVEPPGASQ